MRADVLERQLLEARRQRLDGVAARERVDEVGDAALVADDLLRAERDRRSLARRQAERLVERVRVERLAAAEHGGERLHRDARHVDERLLRRERHPRGLAVEAQGARAVGLRAEAVLS